MASQHSLITSDALAVGLTRPAMRFGVTHAAIVGNAMLTMEVFLLTHNLLALAIALPVHAVCALMCAREPRCFELMACGLRYRWPAWCRTYGFWHASSYSPLTINLPNRRGGRPEITEVLP